MHKALKQPPESGHNFRLLCMMAKYELNAHPDDYLADIVEGVKITAARARIPYDQVRLAIDAVLASGTTTWRGPKPLPDPPTQPDGRLIEPTGPTRQEAVTVLADLQTRLGIMPVRSMPPASKIGHRRIDTIGVKKVQAIGRFIAQEIQESIARCEALEDDHASHSSPADVTRRDVG